RVPGPAGNDELLARSGHHLASPDQELDLPLLDHEALLPVRVNVGGRAAARPGPGLDDQVLPAPLKPNPVAHHRIVDFLTGRGGHDRSLLPACPRVAAS